MNYKESRRWKNFSDIKKLPDEFKNFLFEEGQALKKKLLTFEEIPTISHHPQTSSSSLYNSEDDLSGVIGPRMEVIRVPKSSKKSSDIISSNSSKEISKTAGQVQKTIIQWQYSAKTVFYNPLFRRAVIELWNNTMPHLSDYIFWESMKIEKAIDNPTLFKIFTTRAWDGHRTRAINGQGFVKHKDAYYLKTLGMFNGDPRVKFKKVSQSTDPDSGQVSHLFAFAKYIPKYHSN